jgi:uncharacterized surface protein with fasciclin (FAS1) repeats
MKKLVVLLFVAALGFSCGGDDETPAVVTPPVVTPPALKSIYDIAKGNDKLSFLTAALDRVPLVKAAVSGAGTYTVFAPTNDAFIANGFPTIEDVKTAEPSVLQPILLNHALASIVKSTDIKTGAAYASTLSPGPGNTPTAPVLLSLLVEKDATGKITLNDRAKVEAGDIAASNGIIHIVDKVIPRLKIVEAAKANKNNFKTLVAVLENDAQKPTLDVLNAATPEAPLTVLAPTDTAFKGALDTWAKDATQAQLTIVLGYHVVNKNILSKDLKVGDVTTVGGQIVKVKTITPTVLFEDTALKTAEVIVSNVQCTNGIIHALDKVLQPKLTP